MRQFTGFINIGHWTCSVSVSHYAGDFGRAYLVMLSLTVLICEMAVMKIASPVTSLGSCVRIKWDNECFTMKLPSRLQAHCITHLWKMPLLTMTAHPNSSIERFCNSPFFQSQNKEMISFIEVFCCSLSGKGWEVTELFLVGPWKPHSYAIRILASHH